MIWLERIKTALFDDCYRRGVPRGKVVVDESDLLHLLGSFESVDAELRLLNAVERGEYVNSSHLLDMHIRKMWKSDGQSADQIMFVFSNVIKELLAEKERNAPRLKKPT